MAKIKLRKTITFNDACESFFLSKKSEGLSNKMKEGIQISHQFFAVTKQLPITSLLLRVAPYFCSLAWRMA